MKIELIKIKLFSVNMHLYVYSCDPEHKETI